MQVFFPKNEIGPLSISRVTCHFLSNLINTLLSNGFETTYYPFQLALLNINSPSGSSSSSNSILQSFTNIFILRQNVITSL